MRSADARRADLFTAADLVTLDRSDSAQRQAVAELRRRLRTELWPALDAAVDAAAPAPADAGGERAVFVLYSWGVPGHRAAVGYTAVTGGSPAWRVSEVYVAEPYRRRGGGLLMQLAGIDAARMAGCSEIVATVPASATGAAAMFSEAGFRRAVEGDGDVLFRLPLPFFSFRSALVLRAVTGDSADP